MRRVVNTTIEKAVFSMWFAYIHCGATDVFSMDPPRDHMRGTELNQIRIKKERERENESGASLRQSFIVSCCN
jgi:hypothetical protein